jgi:tetratricopeptide (TPR) repeat protein
MDKLWIFLKVLLVIAIGGTICSCVSAHERAIDITDEVYYVHWGDWEKVVDLTTRAIKIDPDFAWPYYQRGVARTALEEYDNALRDLDKAIKLAPDLEDAYPDRASIFMKKGQYDRAAIDLNAALSLNPYNTLALIAMVELQSLRNNTGSACMFMRKAINNGFNDFIYIQSNENFKNLLESDCYLEFVPSNR